MLKKIVLSLLTVLLILAIWQYEMILYGLRQGQGQLKIVWGAVPLEKVLSREDFPDSLRQKIEVIRLARAFAMEKLSLKNTDNYTTYYDQKGTVALWNVTACQPYRFEAKTWWFPIVGSVPYKGHFNKSRAEAALKELEEEGWDVRMGPVGGWSTLGWFTDPILSSMLDRSDGQLAELIIHELTHSTLFIENEVTFNENLASFVGERGARMFLAETYGDSSNQLREYVSGENDGKKLTNHVLRGTKKLDSLYSSFDEQIPIDEKEKQKQALISEVCESVDTVSFENVRFKKIFERTQPNNAYFMSYLRYYSIGDSLGQIVDSQFRGDLQAYIIDLTKTHGK